MSELYPNVTIVNAGFEQYNTTNQFDLILGNPPYGRETIIDYFHQDLKGLAIHHYFVAKSMRLLKPRGLLTMVLPSYFLDNVKYHARDIIVHEGGHLLSAFRLPDHLSH